MKNSAYCIQRKGQNPVRESAFSHPVNALIGHRGNHIVAHPSPVYTTAKVNRRQLIADKGSFDGGLCYRFAYTGTGQSGQRHRIPPSFWSIGELIRSTFRAALPERRINVDRVSIDRGEAVDDVCRGICVAPQAFPLLSCAVADGRGTATTFNADSYSRCFRQITRLIKQAPPMVLHYAVFQSLPRGSLLNILGRLLSSQLDRKTDCYRKDAALLELTCWRDPAFVEGVGLSHLKKVAVDFGHGNVGMQRERPARSSGANPCPPSFTVAVCGTQTKQGGCLYEQPCSQILEQPNSGGNVLSLGEPGHIERESVVHLQKVRCLCNRSKLIPPFKIVRDRRERPHIWQKPGIGIAAVSPVPKRDIRKGEGTDYPYQ